MYKKTVHTTNDTAPLNPNAGLNLTESQVGVHTPWRKQEILEGFSHKSLFPKVYFLPQQELVPVPSFSAGVNALGLVVFSVCFGLVIGNMKQQGQVLQDFFDSLNEAIMRMVAIVIWSVQVKVIWLVVSLSGISSWLPFPSALRYTPVGILFLVTGKILQMTDLAEMGSKLGMYTLSVIVGLILHALIVLPLLFYMVTKNNPYTFMGGLLQALITALGTSSRCSSSSRSPIFWVGEPKH